MRSRMLRLAMWSLVALILIAVLVLGLRRFALGMDISGAGFMTTYSFDHSEAYEEGGVALPAGTAISSLELEWVAGEVEILFYDGDQISFEETAPRALTERETLRYQVSGGQLTIRYCEPKTGVNRFFRMPEKTIKIMIPKRLSGMNISVENVSASLLLDGGGEALGVLSIESVSGAVRITDAYASSVKVSCVSGNIVFKGVGKKTEVETVSGSVTLDFFETPKDLRVESVSGNTGVRVPESAGFTATLDSISGKLTCDFAEMSGTKKAVHRGGDANFRFETISGSVVISLLQGETAATVSPVSGQKTPERKPSVESPPPVPEVTDEAPTLPAGRKF